MAALLVIGALMEPRNGHFNMYVILGKEWGNTDENIAHVRLAFGKDAGQI